MRPDDVWSARGRASLSTPYSPARGFGEGDGTSPWAWNVLYNVIVKFATMKRRANAQHRGLCCGSPGDGSQKCNLIPTGLVRMTKDRANTPRSKPDDTPLHGKNKNCTRAITWVCPAWIVLHKQFRSGGPMSMKVKENDMPMARKQMCVLWVLECSSWHEVLVSNPTSPQAHTTHSHDFCV